MVMWLNSQSGLDRRRLWTAFKNYFKMTEIIKSTNSTTNNSICRNQNENCNKNGDCLANEKLSSKNVKLLTMNTLACCHFEWQHKHG
jgi:hypothetical protein